MCRWIYQLLGLFILLHSLYLGKILGVLITWLLSLNFFAFFHHTDYVHIDCLLDYIVLQLSYMAARPDGAAENIISISPTSASVA